MKRIVVWVLCAALLSVGCSGCGSSKAPAPRRTVVAGQVINRPADAPEVITWNLCDPIADGRMGMRLTEDGSFRFETDEITRLHDATLSYIQFINLFVAPGDSVHLTIDAARLAAGAPDAVRFGGAHADENAQINAISTRLYSWLYSHAELDKSLEPKALIERMKTGMARTSDSVEAYARRNGIVLSDAVRDYFRRDMLFTLANGLLDYQRKNPAMRLALFGDPFFGIHDTANLRTLLFPYHLHAYMRTKIAADTAVFNALLARDHVRAAQGGVRILQTEPATANRDVMLWQYLSELAEDIPALCDSVPEARTAFTDPALRERFEALCREKSARPVFPPTPVRGIARLEADGSVSALPETDIFAYLAAKYPNKVLYIDVFATWCGPCRAEMKEAPALHELMKGKEVVFVNLCLASDRTAWSRMMAQTAPEGENYWFDSDATQLFMGTYGIPGYPTYILVGRDGRIASMNAERPSALAPAARQIEELLVP